MVFVPEDRSPFRLCRACRTAVGEKAGAEFIRRFAENLTGAMREGLAEAQLGEVRTRTFENIFENAMEKVGAP